MTWCESYVGNAEMEFGKRSKKSKGAKRKTRAMLEAERKGPLTFASLLEEAAASGMSHDGYGVNP